MVVFTAISPSLFNVLPLLRRDLLRLSVQAQPSYFPLK
jgi:hypothetical protein